MFIFVVLNDTLLFFWLFLFFYMLLWLTSQFTPVIIVPVQIITQYKAQ